MTPSTPLPWYRRVRRWGQTNLSEHDPVNYDPAFWRDYWRRTHTQGVIVNAGGIVAYYPSRFALHYRAQFLGGRDLLGEIAAAARAEGLALLARMDSNRANEEFYRLHPDWFTRDAAGKAGRAGERYIACLNSPYTREYLPQVLEEIIERCHPDGFTDNSWSGPGRGWICHCDFCREKFQREASLDLPAVWDWDDAVFRRWVRWSYACRTEVWELNNRVTRAAGGPECLWLGMVNGDPLHSHLSFVDLKEIAARAEILMSDQQGRSGGSGFEQNAQSGKLLHELLGWEKLIPESMAMYVRGEQAFRKASAPPLEARKWMQSGFAGGITPWWHHVGAEQEDKRQFETALPLLDWHAAHEDLLYDRVPIANVGLLWSHENIDFYGRGQAARRVAEPWQGFTQALLRGRIPCLPVHADHIQRQGLDLLILPDLAAMTDGQIAAVRAFVAAGGSVVASGLSGMLDAEGLAREDGGLSDLWGVRLSGRRRGAEGDTASWENASGHNYLRLATPRADTALLPFGGTLHEAVVEGGEVYATYIPAFPIYPPETSWMRQPESDLPAIVTRTHPGGGRGVYFAADIDRCYGRRGLPDHAELLLDAVRWALGERLVLTVEGPGRIDCHLYRGRIDATRTGRLMLHLVNLSGAPAGGWGYLEEDLAVGPLRVGLRLPGGVSPRGARCVVGGAPSEFRVEGGWARFELPRLLDHELVVLE